MPFDIVLVDDHKLVRDGVRMILERGTEFRVVGEAENGDEAVRKVLEVRPDVVVLDIAMPRGNGLEVLRRLRADGCDTKVLVLTMHDEEQYLLQVLRAGPERSLMGAR